MDLGSNFRFRANIQGNLFPPIVVQEGWFVLSERHNFGETTRKEGERKPRQNALAADQRWLIEFVSDAKLVCQFEVTPFSASLPIFAFNLR